MKTAILPSADNLQSKLSGVMNFSAPHSIILLICRTKRSLWLPTMLLTMMLILKSWSLNAQTASPPALGDGSSCNPYRISTLENLYWIAANSSAWDKHFMQTADIDASQTELWGSGGWSPIGQSSGTSFSGKYDGRGHTISGLHMINSDYITKDFGLFGAARGATLINLGITDAHISVRAVQGGTGALLGWALQDVTMTNCYSTGEVSAQYVCGGLVGKSSSNSTFLSCYSTCLVTGYQQIGGLVGRSQSGSSFTNCYHTGTVNGNQLTGGLVGEHANSSMSKCYSTGQVTGVMNLGGLVGYNSGSSVSDSYSRCSVSRVPGFSVYTSCGGLAGSHSNDNIINRCYSTGSVQTDMGGLVGGQNDAWVITNSFWDTETSGTTLSSGGTGKTTAEMKTQSTFTDVGWDFSTIWSINTGEYPQLAPQSTCSNSTIVFCEGTNSRTLCVSSVLDPIVFTVGGGATGTSISPSLPGGLSGVYDGVLGTYTISGTPTAASTYNFTVTTTGTQSPCTEASATGTITVKPTITPSVTITTSDADNKVCQGELVTFTAVTANTGDGTVSYQWKQSGVDVGSNQNSYATSELIDGDKVTCSISIAGSTVCLSSTTAGSNEIVNHVFPNVQPSVTITSDYIAQDCYDPYLVINFTATPANTGGGSVSYVWKLNGKIIEPWIEDHIQVIERDPGDEVTVVCEITVTHAACFASATVPSEAITISIPNVPDAGEITGKNVITVGESTSLSSSIPGGQWYSPDEAIARIDASGVVKGTGIGTVTILYGVAGGPPCNDFGVAEFPITVGGCIPPTPTFTESPLSPQCPFAWVTYTTQSGKTNYVWIFPGVENSDYLILSGGTSADPTVTLMWLTSGSKTVTVNYIENCEGVAPASSTVIVDPSPTATISYEGSPYCRTGTATVTLTGPAGGTFDAGSGLSIDATTGEIDLASCYPDRYNVTYRFTGDNGCSGLTSTLVVINELPYVNITGKTEINVGETTTLNPATGGTWTSNNEAVAPVTNEGIVTGVAAGTATFTFTNTTTGCSATTGTVTVECILPSITSAAANPEIICSGGIVTLSVTGSLNGAAEWKWYSGSCGGTLEGTGPTITVSPSITTTYYIRGEGGCINPFDCGLVTVTVEANPVAGTFGGIRPVAVCEGSSVMVTLTSGSGGNSLDELEFRTKTGATYSDWTAYTSSAAISTTGKSGVEIRTRRMANVCSPSGYNYTTWDVVAQPVAGDIYKIPTAGTICEGNLVYATFSAGSGGVGCSDIYEYRKDGTGEWSVYLPGSKLNSAGHTLIEIRTQRGNCQAGCNAAVNSVSWTVETMNVAGLLDKTPDLPGICEGTSVNATLTPGSGGNGIDKLEFRTKTGETWSDWTAYVSGTEVATTGKSGVEIRTGRIGACYTWRYNTVSWVIESQPTAPSITKSPDVSTICAGTVVSATFSSGSGVVGCSDSYTFRYDGIGEWTTYTPTVALSTTGHTLVEIRAMRGGCQAGCLTASSTVSWTVNTAPTFSACPGNITKNTDANVCTAVVTYTATASGTPAPTVTYAFTGSNPPSPSSGIGTGSGATFNKGVTTVTITASNGCAPNAICSFTVTVTDAQAPVIAEVANITHTSDPGKCYAIVTVTPPGVTDYCDQNIFPINNFELVTNGNFSSGVSRWQEAGNTAEALTEEYYIVPLPSPSSNHVAEIDRYMSLGQNISGFTIGEEYILTFKATRRQNTITPSSVGATVTIDGALSQVVIRTNQFFNLTTTSYTFTATKTTHQLKFTPYNNTGTLGIIIDDISITKRRYPVGITTITWTATDEAGNAAVAKTQTVTVSDNEIPVVNVPTPAASYTADAGECNATKSFAATPTDNCGVLSTVYSVDGTPITFPYDFLVGSTKVDVLVTDIHTNTNTGSFTIVVTDNESPTITAQAVTANSNDDGTGNCTTTVALGTPTTGDNCGIGSTYATVGGSIINPATYLFPVGQTTVTWLVTDIHNNTKSCTQLVTVIDNELPTFTCPANITQTADAGVCYATVPIIPPTALDNCDPNVIIVNSFNNNLVQNGDFNSGVSHWQDCGNTAESNTERFYIVPAPLENFNHVAEIDRYMSLGQNISGFTIGKEYKLTFKATRRQNVSTPNPVSAFVTIDGGALSKVVTRNNTIFNLTPVEYKFTATKTTHQLKFTPYTDNRTSLGFIVDDVAVTQVNATFPIGETQVVWTAIDKYGNASSCTQLITVTDNEDPTASNPTTVNVECFSDIPAPDVAVVTDEADNCGTPVVTFVSDDIISAVCDGDVVKVTRKYKVTDGSTNFIYVYQTINVDDVTPPTVLTKPVTVTLDMNGNASIVAADVNNSSADNCSGALNLELNKTSFTCADRPSTTVTLKGTDCAGNIATCNATVNVNLRPTELVYSGGLGISYSDQVTLKATLKDATTSTPLAGKTITFSIGLQSATAVTNASGVATTTLVINQAPGSYSVVTSFADNCPFAASTDTDNFTITPEKACVDYTGQLYLNTSGVGVSTATLALTWAVSQETDGYAGLLNASTIGLTTKIDSPEGGTATLVGSPVFDEANLVFSQTINVTVTSESAMNFTVNWTTGGNYGNTCDKDAVITVAMPGNDFAAGGGYILLTDKNTTPPSTVSKAGSLGTKNNFGFNIKWGKSYSRLTGSFNTIWRQGDMVWQAKSNCAGALIVSKISIDPDPLRFKAQITYTNVNVRQLDCDVCATAMGNSTVIMTVYDWGEPGVAGSKSDQIGFVVKDNKGKLIYSTNYYSTAQTPDPTLVQNLNAGNIQVKSSTIKIFELTNVEPVAQDITYVPGEFKVYPNPFSETIHFEFVSPTVEHALIEVFDATGRLVKTVFDNKVEAGKIYIADFKPVIPVNTIYIYRMMIGGKEYNGKVVYLR